jgi:hypothetical protein
LRCGSARCTHGKEYIHLYLVCQYPRVDRRPDEAKHPQVS